MNYSEAIVYKYPDAKPFVDFAIFYDFENDKQIITSWNLAVPIPTDDEIAQWYGEYIANKPPEPLSELEELKKQQTDLVFQLMLAGVI